MAKHKDKERILKAAREKQLVTYKGAPIRLSADFSKENLQARGTDTKYSKWWKARTYNQDCSIIYNQRTDKEILRQETAEGIHPHYTGITRNVKETSLRRRKKR